MNKSKKNAFFHPRDNLRAYLRFSLFLIVGGASLFQLQASLRTTTSPIQPDNSVTASAPGGDASVTFPQIMAAGDTTFTAISPPSSAGTPPAGFTILGAGPAYDITTTAAFTPPAITCFTVSSINDAAAFGNVRILHSENGALVDRTIYSPLSPAHDFALRRVCARTNSLSPFVTAVSSTPAPTPGPSPYPEIDLQISQAASANTVVVGTPLTYTLTITIFPSVLGGGAALDTRFNFPSGVPVVFNSAGGPDGVAAVPDSGGVSFTGGGIGVNGGGSPVTATLTVVVTPQSTGTLTSAGSNVMVDPNNRFGEASDANNTAQTIQTSVIAAPVTVGGKVLAPDGRGLRSVTVMMTDSQNNVRTATTSSFGFFSFDNLTPGGTYTFKVQSRSFRFNPQTVLISDAVTLPDFLGLE